MARRTRNRRQFNVELDADFAEALDDWWQDQGLKKQDATSWALFAMMQADPLTREQWRRAYVSWLRSHVSGDEED